MVLIARPWDRAVCPAAPLIEVELGGSVRIPASVPAGLAAAGLKALSLRVVVEPPPMSPGRYKRLSIGDLSCSPSRHGTGTAGGKARPIDRSRSERFGLK
jgi:hypothetical protein